MWGFVLRRFALLLPLTLLVLSLSFVAVQMAPGSPFSTRRVSPEAQARLNAKYGLDQPRSVQFARFLGSLAGFAYNGGSKSYEWHPYPDFGESLKYQGLTVNRIILTALPVSAVLAIAAYTIALIIGSALGILAALRPHSALDRVVSTTVALGVGIPSFVLGPLLVTLFSLTLYWLPPARFAWSLEWGVLRLPTFRTLILPAVTLSAVYVAYIARLVRVGLIEVLGQDFIRTARSKGLPEWRVICVHALRGALLPVVSFSGPAIADLLGGAVVVESMFALPGLGHYFIDAASSRDYFLILGITAFSTLALMLANLVVDLAYTWIDPRIHYEHS